MHLRILRLRHLDGLRRRHLGNSTRQPSVLRLSQRNFRPCHYLIRTIILFIPFSHNAFRRQDNIHRRWVCEFSDLLQLLGRSLVSHHSRVLERKRGDVLSKPALHARISPDNHSVLVAPERVVNIALEILDEAAEANRVFVRLAPSNPRVENLLLRGAVVVGAAGADLAALGREGATTGVLCIVIARPADIGLQSRDPPATRATHEVEVGIVASIAEKDASELLAVKKSIPAPTDGKTIGHLADIAELSRTAAARRLRATTATLLRGDN